MDKIIISGGNPLYGNVSISGMKNAALPVICACMLNKETCIIDNIPPISDIETLLMILSSMGADVKMLTKNSVQINCRNIIPGSSPNELASKLRGSSYILGAELGRFGKSSVYSPGGCSIGPRPLDLHMKAFEALGVGLNYGFTDYLMLGVLIMSTVLMVVAAMSIVSAYARTVKEANSWSSPLMFILMGFSLFNMFEFPSSRVMYLIPFFNSSQCMGAIFAFNLDYVNFFITVAVNLVYTALGVWGLAKMFGSEKVVFGK